jgi:hypothetical protein
MEIAERQSADSWWGWTAWALVYLAAAGALVALFIRFTASAAWAIGLVVFMLGYMTIVGRWASGDINRRE